MGLCLPEPSAKFQGSWGKGKGRGAESGVVANLGCQFGPSRKRYPKLKTCLYQFGLWGLSRLTWEGLVTPGRVVQSCVRMLTEGECWE